MLLCPGIQALLESQCSVNIEARSLPKSEKNPAIKFSKYK